MADLDIETVVDAMRDWPIQDLRSHLIDPDRGCETTRLPCGCDPDANPPVICPEHR